MIGIGARPEQRRRANGRPNIGLLVGNVTGIGGYYAAMWAGVADAARQQDANLICYAGGSLLTSPLNEFEHQHNVLYDLVSPVSVDGLIISCSSLANFVTPEVLTTFLVRYRSLPMVSVGPAPKGVPSILIDNESGLRSMLAHLIEAHGYRRIAFIRGPEHNVDAQQRYQTFVSELAKYDLPLDPNLVAPGDFLPTTGEAAVALLFDERGLKPAADIQAIVAANDNMAMGAMQALEARGIRIPHEIAVVGFDNTTFANAITPALTTVRQPTYTQGQRAVEMLLALLSNKREPGNITLSTELVVRQSCGCFHQAITLPKDDPEPATPESIETLDQDSTITEMTEALAPHVGQQEARECSARLLDAFLSDLAEPHPHPSFMQTLDEMLRKMVRREIEITIWYSVLTAMRRHTLGHLAGYRALSRAADLWQQASMLIGETMLQAQLRRQIEADQQSETLRDISQALLINLDLPSLMNMIVQQLPRLDIRRCCVSLYENPDRPTEWAWLAVAYDENGRIDLPSKALQFPTCQLVPDGLWAQDEACHLMLESLYYRNEKYGIAVFEVGPSTGIIYATLRVQISGALRGALLVRQMEEHALLVQTAAEVSHAASSILDPDVLIQQVVDLARERFDLCYAGLFLSDPDGKWAVLRAGTGEAGRRMLAEDHRLEIGGTSMIGWCIAHKQPRIALDVGREAVRFENPLLPETRSEMALPLVSRGEAIGALTIQSAHEAAFSEDDIAVLQTMADQLANAIANARLYDQAQKEIVERKQAEQALAEQARRLDAELEQFANVAAHDLQEPLRLIASYSQLLKRRYEGQLGKDADEFIAHAVGGATRARDLINDLLKYSQIETRGKPFGRTDCSTALEQALVNLEMMITETGATITHDDLPTVNADAGQIKTLFQHLIHNAIEFRNDQPPLIHISTERRDGMWEFSVQDNGIGIEAHYFERIFRIFRRLHTPEDHPGTGIGLAICKKIVERHGGCIWVESEPGQGSTFTFTLPDRRETVA